MILGVGVDLVEVCRMETALNRRSGERFKKVVFSASEIDVCEKSAHPAQCFAARFAAKEALAKALGTGFKRGIRPAMIRVKGDESSRPYIELASKALELAQTMNVDGIHVSLSHTNQSACAFVALVSLPQE